MIAFGIRQSFQIDDFCKDIVGFLLGRGWQGQILLEYLPEFHEQLKLEMKPL